MQIIDKKLDIDIKYSLEEIIKFIENNNLNKPEHYRLVADSVDDTNLREETFETTGYTDFSEIRRLKNAIYEIKKYFNID